MLWDKKEEWKGFFFVMWIFIKDIPNKILKNMRFMYCKKQMLTAYITDDIMII